MGKLRKILLLLWKNYLMQKKQPIHTLVEILLPLAISCLLVWLRFYVNTEEVPIPTKFNQFSLRECLNSSIIMEQTWAIAWSPNTSPFASEVMKKFNFDKLTASRPHPGIFMEPFADEAEMQRTLLVANNTKVVLVGISFDASVEDIDQEEMIIPQNLQVRILFPGLSRRIENQSTTFDTQFPNWRTHTAFPLYQPFGPRDGYSIYGGQPGYCREGFISVQQAIFESIFELYHKEFSPDNPVKVPEFRLKRFPYPSYVQDRLLPALISFISIFIIFSYTYSAVRTIKLVTVEKETQMKEVMKLMGLSSWMHWTAWLVKEFIQWFILSLLITIALTIEWKNGCVIKNTNSVIVLLILMVFSFTSICFCFLITSFFNKANSAATVGAALWFLSYSPYLIYQPSYESMSWLQIVSWSSLSNTNMGYIFQMIVMYEGIGTGIQWNNFFTPVSPSDKVSPGELTLYLFFDAIFYLLVAVYKEEAWPGAYGMPKPWYFPFQASYWCGYKKTSQSIQAPKGIQIRDLTKIYKNGNKIKKAVKELTLDMYPNQITVLLGHNGAGKSSSMSMLIGLTRPTSGTATINGYDIWSEMEKIRESLGLCPQFDLLFEELTVEEHLLFFGKLKGCYGEDLKREIYKYVTKLEMEKKLYSKAGGLSGGYKRKLSVAIALVGHSEVVLLDEPTSRMDPTARRCLWDLLQEERNNRTMMMTTHLMDEADLLGDRVAILSNGQLKCVGTPFMLKKKYGYGYTLSLVKKRPDLNLDKVTSFLKAHNGGVELVANMETEVKFKLDDSDRMSMLLSELSNKQYDLGIKEFGISLTTLEDVYMRVISMEDELDRMKIGSVEEGYVNPCSISDRIQDSRIDLPNSLKPTSKSTVDTHVKWTKQFGAMIHKKYIISRKGWRLHMIQLCTTLVFLLIATAVTEAWRGSTDLPPLNLTLQNYRNPVIIAGDDGSHAFGTRIFKSIVNTAKQEKAEVIIKQNASESFDDYLLDKYKDRLEVINEGYIFGADVDNIFNNTRIKLHFNNQPFHSFPTALSTVQNAIIKTISGEDFSLTFVNHPLPYVPEEKIKKLEGGSNFGFQMGFNTGFAHAFICATFIVLIMKEQETGAKHLQFISGVKPSAYWSASVLWDSFMYMMSMAIVISYLFYHQDPAFSDTEQLVQVAALLMSYVWAIVPVVNLASYLFTKPSIAFMKTSLLGILTGCSIFVIVLILEIRPLFLVEEANSVESVMTWFPHYILCQGLKNIYLNHGQKAIYKNKGDEYPGNYAWEKPGIGKNLFTLFIIGLVFNLTILSLENIKHKLKNIYSVIYKYWTHNWIHIGRKNPGTNFDHELKQCDSLYEDTDVTNEKITVDKSSKLDYIVIMKNVTKKYGNFTAVKSLNLALNSHECFALLGSNGAGKTTTFKMLTTKIDMTSGSIDICSMDIVRERSKVRKVIGYCPQQDALLEKLTCRETMKMFCTLRGIPKDEHDIVISQLSSRLVFYKFLDVEAGRNSGGNQRKLSTAIAMIGDPPVILLDEPTSGMDPQARRHLWNVIKEERERGKCIIITTHSLEECEVLCTRLAIMVEGEIRCIGSVQHLKNRFASGYKLHVKFPPDKQQNIKVFISSNLTGSSVHEEFEGMILFHIPMNISCSSVFSAMETAKKLALIEDYSIQQTSLEQVFTKVTKKV